MLHFWVSVNASYINLMGFILYDPFESLLFIIISLSYTLQSSSLTAVHGASASNPPPKKSERLIFGILEGQRLLHVIKFGLQGVKFPCFTYIFSLIFFILNLIELHFVVLIFTFNLII